MARAPSVKRALRELSRERFGNDLLWGLLDRYRRSPRPDLGEDRSTVLVAGSFVEQALEDAILTRFTSVYSGEKRESLFGGNIPGAISGFYGKIILGSALGLYPDLFHKDLDTIRQIRNVFAHAAGDINFETPQIKAACEFNIVKNHCENEGMRAVLIESHQKFVFAIFMVMMTFHLIESEQFDLKPEPYPEGAFLP